MSNANKLWVYAERDSVCVGALVGESECERVCVVEMFSGVGVINFYLRMYIFSLFMQYFVRIFFVVFFTLGNIN